MVEIYITPAASQSSLFIVSLSATQPATFFCTQFCASRSNKKSSVSPFPALGPFFLFYKYLPQSRPPLCFSTRLRFPTSVTAWPGEARLGVCLVEHQKVHCDIWIPPLLLLLCISVWGPLPPLPARAQRPNNAPAPQATTSLTSQFPPQSTHRPH